MTSDFEQAIQQLIDRTDPGVRDVVLHDLGELRNSGVNSWRDLVAALGDPSGAEHRRTACWLLARVKDPGAFDPLVSALHDPDPRLREEAARSLGVLGDLRAVPELLAALQTDLDPETRMAAAYALGHLGDHRSVDGLLAKLADRNEDPRIRGMAAEAVTGVQDRQAVPFLIAALDDPSVEVRFWAAFALGQFGDPAALDALEGLARSDDAVLPGWWSIKDEATAAIESIRATPFQSRVCRRYLGTLRDVQGTDNRFSGN
jgi:HEAT repeat protein